ncbi:MAG: VWA domain-containing protein [Acidobacteriota bacterium]|nr:VWA domain-containing protein [Acidobacteriota bacterium]
MRQPSPTSLLSAWLPGHPRAARLRGAPPRLLPARALGLATLSLLLLAALALPLGAAAPAKDARMSRKEEKQALQKLPEKYRIWLQEVEVLITTQERRSFLALAEDYQRDAFIQRFWEVRNRYSDASHNEFRDRYYARLEEARARFHSLEDDRARILLKNGPPLEVILGRCSTLLWPLEVWYYNGNADQMGGEFLIVFYQHWGAGPYRIWDPQEGLGVLFATGTTSGGGGGGGGLQAVASECRDGDRIVGGISWVARQGMGFGMMQAQFDAKPKGPGGEWVTSFGAFSTEVPAGAVPLPGKLSVTYPGRYQSRTMVQGVIQVPTAAATQIHLGEYHAYNFLLTGEILQGSHLFENFRYKFEFPASEQTEGSFPMVFQRPLRPGEYKLLVKLEDLNSSKIFHAESRLQVPPADGPPPAPQPTDPETLRLNREAVAALANGETTLKLIQPAGDLHTGMMRFDTITTGHTIERVTFSLDGKPLLTKQKPPYSVELDLGGVPRTRHLAATAFDAAGSQVASDELLINSAGHRFRVHLTEPQKGKRYDRSLWARAEVEVPEEEADEEGIDRVEIFLDETRVATLFQPPYAQLIQLPKDQLAYVRAVAYLTDGSSTEDLVFVNAPENSNIDVLNVQFVELYTTVLDRANRPVPGLGQKSFTVLEDGVRQDIARFDRVTDLPIHAALVLDTSASMESSIEKVRDAALRFLEKTIKPKDRAAIITFNDHPYLAIKFSKDQKALAGGLAGLKAERGTALYDTIIFSLYYFNGIKGQRAVLLVSDGRDEGSRFTFENALDYARRAGVTIYSIGLGDQVDKKKLSRISEETGGRAFFIKSAAELDPIYSSIEEELRSKYLLAYQSKNSTSDNAFRTVEVKIDQSGLEAKTLRGYFP